MKPVVSSLVALAIAIAPMTALAKPHAKPHAKHKSHVEADKKDDKVAKKDTDTDKAAGEKSEKAPMIRVKAGKKDGAHVKPAIHHAHNVELGGAGHHEPKADGHGAIVAASMRAPLTHVKATTKAAPKASEMPKLPSPNAGKPSKGGAEKGARKPAAQKHETANDANDGEPTRDEELAELVARIRGLKTSTADNDTKDVVRGAEKGDGPSHGDKSAKSASSSVHKGAADGSADTSKRKAEPCSKPPVEIVRGPEIERFELTTCDGTVAPLAVEHLSIMIRPGGAARPTAPIAELAKKKGPELAHGVRRADPRLIERLQSVVDHFSKSGSPTKLSIISGYRPASIGSMHSAGRAIDFRIDGAKNEEIVAFCKTLGDTGCGYYPNSSFVHVDVRDPGAGHVSWIDVSGPGEAPRYVAAWPPAAVDNHRLEKTSMTRTERLAEEGESLLRARRPIDQESGSESDDDRPAELP